MSWKARLVVQLQISQHLCQTLHEIVERRLFRGLQEGLASNRLPVPLH